MLFLPDDHAPIFGIWFRAGLGKTWVRSLLVRQPLLRSWSLSSSFFLYRLSSADALRFQSETFTLMWIRVLQYSCGNDLIRNLSQSVLNTRNRTHTIRLDEMDESPRDSGTSDLACGQWRLAAREDVLNPDSRCVASLRLVFTERCDSGCCFTIDIPIYRFCTDMSVV